MKTITELREAFAAWAVGEALQNAFDLMQLLTDETPITEAGLRELGFEPDENGTFKCGDIRAFRKYSIKLKRKLWEVGSVDTGWMYAESMGKLRLLLLGVGEQVYASEETMRRRKREGLRSRWGGRDLLGLPGLRRGAGDSKRLHGPVSGMRRLRVASEDNLMKPKQLNFRDGIAKTPFGVYCLDVEYEFRWRFSDGSASERFSSRHEAHAAAQADFERRAMECFEGEQS